jgi:type VI secretion system protein ImpL
MRTLTWLRMLVIAIGLLALAALLWYAAPLLAVGDVRPFDNPWMRGITIGFALFATLGYFITDMISRGQQTATLAHGLVGSSTEDVASKDDSETLKTRMTDALLTLKKTSNTKGDPLYDLPWYVIIGPPGSGKTTALINSGLKFPLVSGTGKPAAVAGEGGTRYCDWWFTEEAVLIDTAGRYTTHDSDAQADKSSWHAFLTLLRSNRPKQPINGVFVCISIEDLLQQGDAQRCAHADAIRLRLKELHDELNVDFPVYALFTKADLISGFMDFFGTLREEERRAVWGVTFQTNDKTTNMIAKVIPEFDLLIARLNDLVIDRMSDEPTPQGKVQIFGFPSQMSALKGPVSEFLTYIFEPTRYHANATLRGYYFTSGTQDGTPIDQLVGALSRSFGAQSVGEVCYSGLGKSFFLTDLLQKVVFHEAGWVSTNVKAVRRAMVLKSIGYASLALLVTGSSLWLWLSYIHNTDLVVRAFSATTQYKQISGPLRDETTIADADLARIHGALYHLRTLPAGFETRDQSTPLIGRAGLDQHPRLNVSAEAAYEQGLMRLMRPRLMFRLEDSLRKGITNPALLMEPLQVYLMLAGRDPMDRKRVVGFFQRDFEIQFAGAGNASGRQSLLEHVKHLVTLDQPTGSAAIALDSHLVQEVQGTIARMSILDRAFALLRAAALKDTEHDWRVVDKGGNDVVHVFTSVNGTDLAAMRVPFFYTYNGFHEAFLARIPAVIEQLKEERKVLGDIGNQAGIQAQYEMLPRQLVDRYSHEFITTWNTMLRQLRIRSLTMDKPRYMALETASSPVSPITRIIESIREETSLTRPRPQEQGQGKSPSVTTQPSLILSGGEAPGASVERAFRSYALLIEGDRSQRPVDELRKILGDVYSGLVMLNDPVRAAEGRQKFTEAMRSFESTAGRFPEPFKTMLQTAAASFDSDATGTVVTRLNQGVSEQVSATCQSAISGVYPFVRTSSRDMSFQDFQKMFGPDGVIDRFFQTHLAQYAITSGRIWSWNQASPIGRLLSQRMLQHFQHAHEIKQAFFPNGGGGFSFAVKHLSMSDEIDSARLEINAAQLVVEKQKAPGFFSFGSSPPKTPQNTTATFQWPGPINMSGASLSLIPELQGVANTLRKEGTWAIFRLLDQVNTSGTGAELTARMSLGGRIAVYQFNAVSLPNPFTLTAIRGFNCPSSR